MNLGNSSQTFISLQTFSFHITDLCIKQTSGSITDTNKRKTQFLPQRIYDSAEGLKIVTSIVCKEF